MVMEDTSKDVDNGRNTLEKCKAIIIFPIHNKENK